MLNIFLQREQESSRSDTIRSSENPGVVALNGRGALGEGPCAQDAQGRPRPLFLGQPAEVIMAINIQDDKQAGCNFCRAKNSFKEHGTAVMGTCQSARCQLLKYVPQLVSRALSSLSRKRLIVG